VRSDYARRHVEEAAVADLSAAIRAVRPGILDFVSALAREAGVAPAIVDARCIAIAYSAAAVNLADDLADAECDYLEEPYRSGPTTQYLLQCLFFQKLCELGTPADVLYQVTCDFEHVAALQHVELTTRSWAFDTSRRVAEGITGRQLAAYLRVALAGSDLAKHALAIGVDVGVATHVAVDAQTRDPRFTTLPDVDKIRLVEVALASTERAEAFGLDSIRPVSADVHRALDPIG
jgi:hypothetical protein